MQYGLGVGGQVREVLANQALRGDQVGPILEPTRVGRRGVAVHPQGPRALLGGLLSGLGQPVNFAALGSGVQIAAPVELDAVGRPLGHFLQQLDAAVHKGHHGPVGAGPPVAVGLAGLVRGERERVALLNDHHLLQALLYRQVVGCRHPGNTGPTDHDLGCLRWHKVYTVYI